MIFLKMVSKVSILHKGFLRRSRHWRRSRQPALVLHVLRLVLHVLCSSRFRVPPLPTSYRLPAKREALVVKKVKWSEVSEWWKKWCKKGPLFFLKLIYMIDHVYTYNPICIKIVRQLSYGFKSLQTFGDPTKKNQNHIFYMIFFKMVLKVSILHKGFFGKI